MYKRNRQEWSKHLDFIILEELCLQAAFILASYARDRIFPYSRSIYRDLGIVLMLLDIVVLVFINTMHNVLKRGYLVEFIKTLRQCVVVFALANIYMFAVQRGGEYSRKALFVMLILHIVFSYVVRVAWKKIVLRFGKYAKNKDSMLVVVEPSLAEATIGRLNDRHMDGYRIAGVVLTGDDERTVIGGVPVVSTLDDAATYISREWVDSVYFNCPSADDKVRELADDCCSMGIPVHQQVAEIGYSGYKQFADKIGGATVLTTSISYVSPVNMMCKRAMDIIGGLFGSLAALIVMAIVGPMIKKASPGPLLFKQERIGLNGKRFMMYKIRSMYVDADARKQELMEKNRVSDGMMFKLDFDPRVIGNRIGENGEKITGIGDFIRRYSIDEFPQFFNVLIGQMSLVGTRPPTTDEWEKYKFHHRARLACKPGITGMWQVSGRSKITDFEEVVRLDTSYITNWSLSLDIKIMAKTIKVIFSKDSGGL